MNLAFVLFLFQPAQLPEHALLSQCDPSAEVVAGIAKDTPLEIHFAIGGASTCYSVTAKVDGKEIKGYVLDRELSAVVAFENARAEAEREAFRRVPVPSPAQPPAANTTAVAKQEDPKTAKPVKPRPKVSM